MSRDNVAIFLDLARTPRTAPLNQYWAICFYVDDVDAMAKELAARGVAFDREPENQSYGCRDFDIRDPDGHVIGIGQNELSAAGKPTLPYA
jgi:catechol 2,3-dioxygenase-like lactoylglutathione lyase family enzyme